MVAEKTALIFGATGGIGTAIVDQLAHMGYNLGLSSTRVVQQVTERICASRADVKNPEEVQDFVSRVFRKFKTIDVLVNSVGVTNTSLIEELSLKDLEAVFEINVYGLFNTIKAVLPIMIEQKRGHIIIIGSLRGAESSKRKAAYCMTKAAVSMFSKVLRKEVKDYGIKVTLLNPGFTDTTIYKEKVMRPFLQMPDGSFEEIPVTLPSDIAKAVSFILGLSKGALVEEFNIGELFGERKDICLRERK